MAKRPGHERNVLVVGVGDDGPAGLTPAVMERVRRAELLVGGQRHLTLFPDVVPERQIIAGDLDVLIRRIDAASIDRRVVVLASGDPCFFGIGPLLVSRLGRSRVEILPQPSSVSLAFARLGVGWQDARVVSAHGRPLADAVGKARGASKLAVLTDDANTPGVMAAALLAAGADDAPAWVFEHLGGVNETEIQSPLTGLPGREFSSLNVLVVPKLTWSEGATTGGGFGLPESSYAHTASFITKPEVRAISLSKLRLHADSVVWDVGAGSGSLGIEAAGLAHEGRVFLVERSEAQRDLLGQNVAASGDGNRLTIVPGEAPEALGALPDPAGIFIGGSGGRLIEILDVCRQRLRPGGRIVVNLVTYEHVAEAQAWARQRQVMSELVQVSVARGSEILNMTRLQAENPVTILTFVP